MGFEQRFSGIVPPFLRSLAFFSPACLSPTSSHPTSFSLERRCSSAAAQLAAATTHTAASLPSLRLDFGEKMNVCISRVGFQHCHVTANFCIPAHKSHISATRLRRQELPAQIEATTSRAPGGRPRRCRVLGEDPRLRPVVGAVSNPADAGPLGRTKTCRLFLHNELCLCNSC